MLGTFLVVGLLVAVAGTVLLAQFTAAGIVAVSPFAAVALILPASAWARLASGPRFLGAMVAVVNMSLLLAVGLRGLVAMLGATEAGLLPRFTLFLVMALALVMARKKFAQAGHSMASKAGERLSSVRVAGAGGGAWVVPNASADPWALPGGAYLAEKARHAPSSAMSWHRERKSEAAAASQRPPPRKPPTVTAGPRRGVRSPSATRLVWTRRPPPPRSQSARPRCRWRRGAGAGEDEAAATLCASAADENLGSSSPGVDTTRNRTLG